MPLRDYASKRRFGVTPEPPAATSKRRGRKLAFVVQKHRASHLHYDFRLEWNGVLLSWAVPKGPSTDPSVKRLAMAVEDHPIKYADFEGVIPAGEYGGGTVMIWDRGTYTPEDPNVGKSLREGEIKFSLHGEKLAGNWVLVRTGGSDSRQWMLIKRRSDQQPGARKPPGDLLSAAPRSVASDRLMAEIAFESGGDVERAADADPPAEIRKLLTRLKRAAKPKASRTQESAPTKARPRSSKRAPA